MTTLGINEKFTLSFLVPKNEQALLHFSVLKKITSPDNISTEIEKSAPSLTRFMVVVQNIKQAAELMQDLYSNIASIEDINKSWDMGLFTPEERTEQLSKFMSL